MRPWILGMLLLAATIGGGIILAQKMHRRQIAAGPELFCPLGSNGMQSRRDPMYILPHIQPNFLPADERFAAIGRTLDALEPGGAAGRVRLGYTLGAMPLGMYAKKGEAWQLDLAPLEGDLAQAARLGRPFVLYVMADHFQDANLPLVKELASDPRNLMRYRDGGIPREGYFGFQLTAFTLSNDEAIPVVHYTMQALRAMATVLEAFRRAHPGLLVGIEINGETHYFYPDFFKGNGDFHDLRFSDYAAPEIADFAAYLKAHGRTETAEAIRSIDFHRNEAGYLPISGWVKGTRKAVLGIEMFVDGKPRGEAEWPISRMDAFEDRTKHLSDPTTGFTARLDVSDLAPGRHLLQVNARHYKGLLEIGRREFTVGPAALAGPPLDNGVRVEGLRPPWDGSLDQPMPDAVVDYHPLARDWLAFRSQQIVQHVAAMAAVFRQAGMPESVLFSYQLAPWMVGSWNEDLFGVGKDFFRMPGVTPGINLYGGNLANPRIFRYLDPARRYAIPEAHPQMTGMRGRIGEALRYHYCHGAVFLAPYYLGIGVPAGGNDIERFRLSPENRKWGSRDFLDAVAAFVKQ